MFYSSQSESTGLGLELAGEENCLLGCTCTEQNAQSDFYKVELCEVEEGVDSHWSY